MFAAVEASKQLPKKCHKEHQPIVSNHHMEFDSEFQWNCFTWKPTKVYEKGFLLVHKFLEGGCEGGDLAEKFQEVFAYANVRQRRTIRRTAHLKRTNPKPTTSRSR